MLKQHVQNIYDNPDFFAGYQELRRTESGINVVLEQPAFRRLLPPLAGLRILDVGCGFGHFARYAREQQAHEIYGIDPSEKMLIEALHLTQDAHIHYIHRSIEEYAPVVGSFDLVVSSLALHYVQDYKAAVRKIQASLKSGGRFVFSVEHPICTASPTGWCRDLSLDELHWPIDNYHNEGKRLTRWFIDGVVKFHRTVESYLNGLIEAGFRLIRVEEPTPAPEALQKRPELSLHFRRPSILLIAAQKI